MQKKQDTQNSTPVELTPEQLQAVAGGLPRGGWSQDGSVTTDATSTTTSLATASTDPTPLPRGGW